MRIQPSTAKSRSYPVGEPGEGSGVAKARSPATSGAPAPQQDEADHNLRVRWLGRTTFGELDELQRAFVIGSTAPYLLMAELAPVYTLGRNADPTNVGFDLNDPPAEVRHIDRGGDVTWHGPGQLVGFPLLRVNRPPGGARRHVYDIEAVVIEALKSVGLSDAARFPGYPGVWTESRHTGKPVKVAAIGVRIERGRTLHGFAINVSPDLAWFANIVACGISDHGVSSLRNEGFTVALSDVRDAVFSAALRVWADENSTVDAHGVDWVPEARWLRSDEGRSDDGSDIGAHRLPQGVNVAPGGVDRFAASAGGSSGGAVSVQLRSRMDRAGLDDGLRIKQRKPTWLRAALSDGEVLRDTRTVVREQRLVTVCEEAGCPNLSECWAEGTATFMVNGERCTRACGFCLVDTRKPQPQDADEPHRVADAVLRLGLTHAVITTVARDDLEDGGAGHLAATVAAIREKAPNVTVELLISDCGGDERSLKTIFDSNPDVLNHNVETVLRLQRVVRPSAGYGRSLAVLAAAKRAGLRTKSGLMVGLGESRPELESTLKDLAAVAVDIVTIGQYLRPTGRHLPVARWWEPQEFEELAKFGRGVGIRVVQASPLTRSSHHAGSALAEL